MDVNSDDVASQLAVNPPAWLVNDSMPAYFHEGLNTTTRNLPNTSCLVEVVEWIKSKKKEVLPEVDPNAYGSSFMAWLLAIQLTWRLSDDTLFVYKAPPDKDWKSLSKGGSAGLYTVVVTLSWWIQALPSDLSPCLYEWLAV
ncbi:hypothetical protein K443DRAFT_11414 [Laccaria amethystina LaAM-08-1]|uniref:Uncharacterized protein n=1 Tax=Laccaria amethystina LaAM-08-1 TaxID=1095629 RepID=A0A0C9XH09_9AGAR|nr:hypothetical protein K443DRAFT_11414 [Laccaria amethystina LaAM-08-1]